MNKEKQILERFGWTIDCQSPFEISHKDGSFASGQAAHLVLAECKSEFKNEHPLVIEYKNWKGEIGIRKIIPIEIFFGANEFHGEPQWLMVAYDLDKKEERTFAMNDIIKFISDEKS
jgi:predicted DNA-binding transcriptional regulator YafY